jgi:hypothetical protein
MDIQWFIQNLFWLFLVEIQEIEHKMMFGYLIHKKLLSHGLNMIFKQKLSLVHVYIIQQRFVRKVLLWGWW